MDQREIVTLVFPNFSVEPVRQRWRLATLCKLPFFDRLFAQDDQGQHVWGDGAEREIEMEEDPEVFSRMMKYAIFKDEKSYIHAMADYYGVPLTERKKVSVNGRGVSDQCQRQVLIARGGARGTCEVPRFRKLKNLKMERSVDTRQLGRRDLESHICIDDEPLRAIRWLQLGNASAMDALVVALNERLSDTAPRRLEFVVAEPVSEDLHLLLTFLYLP